MTGQAGFVSPSSQEILDALGVPVSYVLADLPWSFRVTAGGGEQVGVYVTEHPDTVDVDVTVHVDGAVTFRSCRHGATRLLVGDEPPEIVVESGTGTSSARLEISLEPRLVIADVVGRPDN